MATTMTMAKALNGAFVARWREPQGPLDGRGHRSSRRRLRITDGLQRTSARPRHRLAVAVGHRRPASDSRSAATARSVDSFDASSTGVRPIVSQVANCTTFRRRVQHGDGHSHSFQGGIGAIEHHSESPSLLRTNAGLRVVSCRRRMTPTGYQQSIECDDRSSSANPRVVWKKRGRSRTPPAGLFDAVGDAKDDSRSSATRVNEDRASCGRDGGG